jgi:hypothetical protein
MIDRPLTAPELAVQFGLEPVDVEWLMGSYRRGMPDAELRQELQVLGCSPRESQQLLELIARATAAAAETLSHG